MRMVNNSKKTEPSLDPPEDPERLRIDVANAGFGVLRNHMNDPQVMGDELESGDKRTSVVWHLRRIFEVCGVTEIELDSTEDGAYRAGDMGAAFEDYV